MVIYAHPVDTSFQSALHRVVLDRLHAGGHHVDDCDLYAEGFDPVLDRGQWLRYHDPEHNRAGVAGYVDRLLSADAMVLVFPVWNFGFPAILKGFFDRVFVPGVSFVIENGLVVPCLDNVTRLTAVTSYGAPRWRAFMLGDPPRRQVTGQLRATIRSGSRVRYLSHYDINRSTAASRAKFLQKVVRHMDRF